MRRSSFAKVTAVGVLASAILGGCGADYAARQIIEHNTNPGRVFQDMTGTADQLIKAGAIDLHRRIKSADGVEIDVWVIKARKPAGGEGAPGGLGTVVILHGLTESKASFPYFGAAKRLANKGYDVVLPDLRAHGRSGGKYVTFGAKEKYDVKTVMDALLREGAVREPICVFGVTLGAATAIQYAAIDPRCKKVFAMTPYKDVRSLARRRLLMLSDKDFQAALKKAGTMAKFDPDEASSVAAAGKLKVPLLLVHGMLDVSVPTENSDAIFAAAGGPKKLIAVTPGPEQIALVAVMEDWIAEKVDALVKKGLPQK